MPKSLSGVYQILNRLNGKRYIGSSEHLSRRWRCHRNSLKRGDHHSSHLQAAWNLYGGDAFAFLPLEHVADADRLRDREQEYLDLLGPEYNASPSAYGSAGQPHTEETKRKIADAHRGRKKPPMTVEQRANIAAAQRGRKNTEETKRRMSAAALNRKKRLPFSEAARRNMADAQRGKTLSDEHKTRISVALTGRAFSEDHRQNLSCAMRKLSDQDVLEIKDLLEHTTLTQREIASRYGVHRASIGLIKNGRPHGREEVAA